VKFISRLLKALCVAAACASIPAASRAQRIPQLPPTRADFLLREGRWAEAESEFYLQSDRMPRDPVARAALGRFLAMKGAVRPGSILVEEAKKFGLEAMTARALLEQMKAIIEWRSDAASFQRDTTMAIRTSRDAGVLFRVGMPRTDRNGRMRGSSDASELVWHDIVDRPIGLDSVNAPGSPMGFEVFEALSPSIDVRAEEMTLHANSRSALSANGRRLQVLRWTDGVQVQMGDSQVLPLIPALRALRARWWQLDLVHGVLVVR
jgi:hypothetical protein